MFFVFTWLGFSFTEAATAPPPSAMNNAITEITFAKLSRRLRAAIFLSLFSSQAPAYHRCFHQCGVVPILTFPPHAFEAPRPSFGIAHALAPVGGEGASPELGVQKTADWLLAKKTGKPRPDSSTGGAKKGFPPTPTVQRLRE